MQEGDYGIEKTIHGNTEQRQMNNLALRIKETGGRTYAQKTTTVLRRIQIELGRRSTLSNRGRKEERAHLASVEYS